MLTHTQTHTHADKNAKYVFPILEIVKRRMSKFRFSFLHDYITCPMLRIRESKNSYKKEQNSKKILLRKVTEKSQKMFNEISIYLLRIVKSCPFTMCSLMLPFASVPGGLFAFIQYLFVV